MSGKFADCDTTSQMIFGPAQALAKSRSGRSKGKTTPLGEGDGEAPRSATRPRIARTGQTIDGVPARASDPDRPSDGDRRGGHSAGTWATRGSRRVIGVVDGLGAGRGLGGIERERVDDRGPAEGPPQQITLGLEAQPIEDVPLLVRDVQREQRPVDGGERRLLVPRAAGRLEHRP